MADVDDKQGEPKKNKTRGKTTCAKIYARLMHEREEVTFDMGHPVGQINQSVSNLTSFVGTLGRNKRFVSLSYTNWLAVPQAAKDFIWKYVNTKFILPASCKKWVIQSARDAWKRFKGKLKRRHFVPYDNIEDMRAASRTNEEPKRFEIFIATRTSQKRKELDEETQSVIQDFQSLQASGEIEEEAFKSIFGKEQPGRVRCHGRSITQSDLKRHAEISALKEQHQEEVQSLKGKLGDVREEVHGLRNIVKLLLQRSEPRMSPEEIEAMLKNPQHSPVDANSGHGSTHIPNINMSPTHKRGSWRLCMLQPDSTTPRQPLIKSRHGKQLCLSTLRRRNPRICVDRHSSASEASRAHA
ncbi:hypothetical protein PIB30_092286 [Stylosanthes scabra]|uniref:Transposase, Ptta/En/Spm, plant n=1 Tax=Stylosanthes scabra TaxID=79078 RepID=A0ABU6QU97_9FABA|nr:hypothetical protein [Stylosanthes scabra]